MELTASDYSTIVGWLFSGYAFGFAAGVVQQWLVRTGEQL